MFSVKHTAMWLGVCAVLQVFEDKLAAATSQKQLPERKKKEAFKRLVQDIVGVRAVF